MWIQFTINLVFKKSSLCKIFLEKDFGIKVCSLVQINTHFAFSMKICILPQENMFLSLLYIQYVVLQYYYVCISKLQFLLYSNIPVMGLLYQGLHFISPTYFRNTQFAGFYIYIARLLYSRVYNHLFFHYRKN